jgi:RecJ-like exonuclease
MRCESCHGTGRDFSERARTQASEGNAAELTAAERPCPDCQGSGIAHCCDGMCEQPQAQ